MATVQALFEVHEDGGANLLGLFSSTSRALDFKAELQVVDGITYQVEAMELDPTAPARAVDVSGYTEVTSADSLGYSEYVDDRGVQLRVPHTVEIVGGQ